MEIILLDEAGYYNAMVGLSLSYNIDPAKASQVAEKLCHKDGGHNKFLESMVVWMDIIAPRYWWQQFDTYRVGVTKQSESTMHTLLRKPLTQDNFQYPGIPETVLNILNDLIAQKNLEAAKALLPESFLQRRVVCTNYKTLKNIVDQRSAHKLPEWKQFIESLHNLDSARFIFKKEE